MAEDDDMKSEFCFTKEQVEILKSQSNILKQSSTAVYEGINLEDEAVAEKAKSYLKSKKSHSEYEISFAGDDIQLGTFFNESKKEIGTLFKQLLDLVTKRTVWINPSKAYLQFDYVERSVYEPGQVLFRR